MGDKPNPPGQEPAEGSRETIDRNLEQQARKDGEKKQEDDKGSSGKR